MFRATMCSSSGGQLYEYNKLVIYQNYTKMHGPKNITELQSKPTFERPDVNLIEESKSGDLNTWESNQ
jgi:hypothetical protein